MREEFKLRGTHLEGTVAEMSKVLESMVDESCVKGEKASFYIQAGVEFRLVPDMVLNYGYDQQSEVAWWFSGQLWKRESNILSRVADGVPSPSW